MIMLIIGIAVGAAFSKFWLMLWQMAVLRFKVWQALHSKTEVTEPTTTKDTLTTKSVNEKEI